MNEKGLGEIIQELQAMLPVLKAQHGVKNLWVFGSRATGDAKPSSDLDILVEFSKRDFSLLGFIGIEQSIGDQLGMKVDLVDIDALRPEIKPFVQPQAVAV